MMTRKKYHSGFDYCAKLLAEKKGISSKTARKELNLLMDCITQALAEKKKITFVGNLTIQVSKAPIPHNGNEMFKTDKKDSVRLSVRASEELKSKLLRSFD